MLNLHVTIYQSYLQNYWYVYTSTGSVLGKKPGDLQLANFENYQTFDPGRVLHSYFEILNTFNFINSAHSLFSQISFKYMAYHGWAFGRRLHSHVVIENMQHGNSSYTYFSNIGAYLLYA
jgi:hypothetical protein